MCEVYKQCLGYGNASKNCSSSFHISSGIWETALHSKDKHLLWVELSPYQKKKRYIDILTSSALERDLIWKKSIFRFDQVRMRSQGWA